MERHPGLLHWHHTHLDALGLFRLHHRVIRHFGAVWRLLCYNCGVRRRDTYSGAVDCKGFECVGRGGDESGESGLMREVDGEMYYTTTVGMDGVSPFQLMSPLEPTSLCVGLQPSLEQAQVLAQLRYRHRK
jgi:hypothetical protein